MQVQFQLPDSFAPEAPPAVVTIGNFDGVHRGHQHLLHQLVETARGMAGESVVITFDPHPRCVLRPGECPAAITVLEEKRDLLERAGVDRLIVFSFTKAVSQWSAEYFVDQLLAGFNLRHLVVGHDFALGHDRRGDLRFLTAYGGRHGFSVSSVAQRNDGGEAISSTRVRGTLYQGDVTSASRLLGHRYFIDAIVEHGQQLGRTLGYPTANLNVPHNKCLPARGIYTMWLHSGEKWYMAATSIGYRPTFGGDRLMVEAYILDFDEDIYRQRVRAVFESRLRDELTFDTPDSLIHQMSRDVDAARSHLTRVGPPVGLG